MGDQVPPRSPHLNGKAEQAQRRVLKEFWATVDPKADGISDALAVWAHGFDWRRGQKALGGATPFGPACERMMTMPLRETAGGACDASKERLHARERAVGVALQKSGNNQTTVENVLVIICNKPAMTSLGRQPSSREAASMNIQPADLPQHTRFQTIGSMIIAFCAVLLGTTSVHAQPTAPASAAPSNGIVNGQRQQPTRPRTQALLRQDNVAPTTQERKQQLRTLNQLNQKLLPGSKAPAPNVEPRR